MKKKVRQPVQEEKDRRNISRMYLRGMTQCEIAEELGLSQSTVSRDIKALVEEWKVERVYDINEAKARELAKIDNLELEYWQAWKRSQEDSSVKTNKAVKKGIRVDKEGKPVGYDDIQSEQQEQKRAQIGEARFLAGVQWCIEQRCKVLGVNAPININSDNKVELIVKYATDNKLAETPSEAE